MKKQQVLDLVAAMPDEIDPEELAYRLYVLRKLDAAVQEAREHEDELMDHDDFVRESAAWPV